jgi:sulfur carrier protein
MDIRVNGTPLQVEATTLARLVAELDYEDNAVATAVNQCFVRRKDRQETELHDGDEIEILTPRQGG